MYGITTEHLFRLKHQKDLWKYKIETCGLNITDMYNVHQTEGEKNGTLTEEW